MTKSEFDVKFNEKYKEALLAYSNDEYLKSQLEKFVDEDRVLTKDALLLGSLMLSAEFTKNFIHSILTDILELPE